MHAWESIQISIEYIEHHIEETITIEDLAELYGTAVFKADQFMKRWIDKHHLQMSDFGIEMYYHNNDIHYLEHWGKEKEAFNGLD